VVKYGNTGLAFRHEFAVDIDQAFAHCRSPKEW
jgi:hypothetical protein